MRRSCVLLSSIISIVFGGFVIVGATSALEYQTNPSSGDNPVTLKFEFGQTLTISTDGNISIASLTPGTKAISNSNYNVTVSTNNLTGYTLSATVGCSSGTDCYDNKNLSDGTNNFTMLATDGTLTSGTWGVSLDSSATENSNFKTLAKYDETATILNQTTSNTGTAATGYTGTDATTVRIGAYAANSQVAGTYTNSINFIAVANAAPSRYMQDITATELATRMPNVGDSITLYDKRDEQAYTVAHLLGGGYWMTKNLNLAGGTVLEHENTNVPENFSNNRFVNGNTLPVSSTTGFSSWAEVSVYNTNNEACSSTEPCSSYYSYTAAVAGDISTATGYAASYDICPSGWRLPTSAEYEILESQYNRIELINGPFSALFSGYYVGDQENSPLRAGGSGAYYWSSTTSFSSYAKYLYVGNSGASVSECSKSYGASIRCIAKT